jgi:glutamyl/glutaminyl-tRNA synthetase
LTKRLPLSRELFFNKRAKLDAEKAEGILTALIPFLSKVEDWTDTVLLQTLEEAGEQLELKKGLVMGALRAGLAAQQVTPGGAVETAVILGQAESLSRLDRAIQYLREA